MALPEPEHGLVISFDYLWFRQRDAGLVEGQKTRPCRIVLSVAGQEGGRVVTVAPITHTEPRDLSVAMEIPPRIKAHLGLDAARSWIMLDEFNQFTWPGFDLRPIPGHATRFHFGLLPPNFFLRVARRVIELRRAGLTRVFSRDEK